MKIKILIMIAVFAFSATIFTSCGCEVKTEITTSPRTVDTESGEVRIPRETVTEITVPSADDKESNNKPYPSDKKSSKDSKSSSKSSKKTSKSDTENSNKKSSKADTERSDKKSGKSQKSSSSAKSPTENITADKDENELPFVPIE